MAKAKVEKKVEKKNKEEKKVVALPGLHFNIYYLDDSKCPPQMKVFMEATSDEMKLMKKTVAAGRK